MRGGPINVESLAASHEVLQRLAKAQEENDTATLQDILGQLIQREQDGYQRKQKLLAELNALRAATRAETDTAEHISRLIAAFKFAADLRAIGYDELDDRETGTEATWAAVAFRDELRTIVPAGVAALAELLIDPSVNIRSSAAIALLREMPERAIPVLEEVRQTARGSTTAVNAGLSLGNYRDEIAGKS